MSGNCAHYLGNANRPFEDVRKQPLLDYSTISIESDIKTKASVYQWIHNNSMKLDQKCSTQREFELSAFWSFCAKIEKSQFEIILLVVKMLERYITTQCYHQAHPSLIIGLWWLAPGVSKDLGIAWSEHAKDKLPYCTYANRNNVMIN